MGNQLIEVDVIMRILNGLGSYPIVLLYDSEPLLYSTDIGIAMSSLSAGVAFLCSERRMRYGL